MDFDEGGDMRSSLLAASLTGCFLLSSGCGSESAGGLSPGGNAQDAAPANAQDAAPANAQDAAPANPQDAAVERAQDAAPAGAPDAAAVSPPDAAANDAQASTPEPSPEAGANPEPMARSSLVRVTAELDDTEKGEMAQSLSGFAFALLQEVRRDPAAKDNFAFSPTSVSLALAMAYAGAMGNTAVQMKAAMHVAAANDAYFRSLNWLDQQLGSRAAAALKQAQDLFARSGGSGTAPDPADYRLQVVNAAWGERTMTFEQPYLDTLATEFGAGIHLADFKTQPEAERLAINAWVSEETLDRINDLIPAGAIDPLTRAVLVNAIHLKLPWYDPFSASATTSALFTKTDGSTVSVPFLNKTATRSYAEDDTTQAVAVPLSGGSIDFVVFLPKATSSLAQLEDSLSPARAQALIARMGSQGVALALPKFTFTTASVSLRTVLTALGMTDAFGAKADFSGITKEAQLFISDVFHKAMVAVDEHGVEAAAATAVIMGERGAPTDVKQMDVNRPFFFGIYDRPTATWLFLGHVTDPSS
ncbi:MAG: serpin family protein [Deltaproteobacteria bacterium]|nr:serpin family protein [Deltaproteobacteria bacterium]